MTPKQICETLATGVSCNETIMICYGGWGKNIGTPCPIAESLRCNEVGSKQASIEWLQEHDKEQG